ncbi:ead/Ea22-like family protein [Escherichia coli]|nr:ead/Ea22-like family protein [Escherichia coli]EFN4544080.1 ead/Ea22-like family protein [Escherichia coli]
MSKIDYQALREAAEQATKGSYIVGHTSVNQHGNLTGVFVCQKWKGEPGGVIAECHVNCLVETDVQAYANAEFIAAFNPNVALALLDELEAKDSSISTQQHEIRTLLNALEQATEKRNSDIPGQKRLIGWRASDYTDETSDPELAKNWAAAIGVLPIFEGDVNTKLSAAGIKGE